jgi:hypothetical protein
MGRRKIEIKPIKDDRNRSVTFLKRKSGLFKKAHELGVLCQVDVAVIILGKNNNKIFDFSSTPHLRDTLQKYLYVRIIQRVHVKLQRDIGNRLLLFCGLLPSLHSVAIAATVGRKNILSYDEPRKRRRRATKPLTYIPISTVTSPLFWHN